MEAKVFVAGDIHGCHKALLQCLERSNFNKEEDTLIQLGDVADGWNEVYECVEELLTIKNLIAIKGNHDDWFLDFILYGVQPVSWQQGGVGTLSSYCRNLNKEYLNLYTGGYTTNLLDSDIPLTHQKFFKQQHYYYIDNNDNCFVHGGFNRHYFMSQNQEYFPDQFWWDRDLWMSALSFKDLEGKYKFKMKDNFKEVFIGHTTTGNWKKDTPMKAANIWNLDTGAGFEGKLTIMDINTHEFWQSDNVRELYPDQKGRN
jgi:serine/threonine protein phosphatase 1